MDVYSSTQLVRIAPLSHLDDGLLTPTVSWSAEPTHYLETLQWDLACLLLENTRSDVVCVLQHSPRWSGAACGDGRGRVREFVHW